MAVPTAPTITTLLTEAFRRAGIPSPSSAQLLRAEDEWLEEVKRDLAAEKRWHVLEETVVLIPTANTQLYQVPSPLIDVSVMRFYYGVTRGTAQTGTVQTLTVAAGAGKDQDLGRKLYVTSGTGNGQANRVISRSGDVYTMSDLWATTPNATTVYMIADTETEVIGPEHGIPMVGLTRANLIQYWDYHEHVLRLWPVPDQSYYALELDGQVDLSLIDETDARLTRILREWRIAIVLGVAAKVMEDHDDASATAMLQKYELEKQRLMRQDSRKRRRWSGGGFRSPGGLPLGQRFGRYSIYGGGLS